MHLVKSLQGLIHNKIILRVHYLSHKHQTAGGMRNSAVSMGEFNLGGKGGGEGGGILVFPLPPITLVLNPGLA